MWSKEGEKKMVWHKNGEQKYKYLKYESHAKKNAIKQRCLEKLGNLHKKCHKESWKISPLCYDQKTEGCALGMNMHSHGAGSFCWLSV